MKDRPDSPDRERRLMGYAGRTRDDHDELYQMVRALEERVRILDAELEALRLDTPLRRRPQQETRRSKEAAG